MKRVYHKDGVFQREWDSKEIDPESRESLAAEFRRRAEECGGCNRQPDEEANAQAPL